MLILVFPVLSVLTAPPEVFLLTDPILETIAETVPEATEAIIEATEVITQATEAIAENVAAVSLSADQFNLILEYLNYLAAFGLFFVIVILCYFGYKFLRIFF